MRAEIFDGPWWAAGTLDKSVHAPLIANRVGHARRAGLGEAYMHCIWQQLPPEILPHEKEWMHNIVRKIAQPQHLALAGDYSRVCDRMRVYTGALVRNFIDARIMSVAELLQYGMSGEELKATVLFIPDFATSDAEKASDAVKRAITGVIRPRLINGQVMCIYAHDKEAISRAYGKEMAADVGATFIQGAVK